MSNEATDRSIRSAETQIRRRRLLAVMLASLAFPAGWRASIAQNLLGTGTTLVLGDKFMKLSAFATGRSKLDPAIGAALLAALRESDAASIAVFDSLAADATSGKYADVEGLEVALRGTPKHTALLTIVAAWYTGSVSSNGSERFITLQEALLYQPIQDGSHIPGNCAGATNAWADQSAPALDALPVAG